MYYQSFLTRMANKILGPFNNSTIKSIDYSSDAVLYSGKGNTSYNIKGWNISYDIETDSGIETHIGTVSTYEKYLDSFRLIIDLSSNFYSKTETIAVIFKVEDKEDYSVISYNSNKTKRSQRKATHVEISKYDKSIVVYDRDKEIYNGYNIHDGYILSLIFYDGCSMNIIEGDYVFIQSKPYNGIGRFVGIVDRAIYDMVDRIPSIRLDISMNNKSDIIDIPIKTYRQTSKIKDIQLFCSPNPDNEEVVKNEIKRLIEKHN